MLGIKKSKPKKTVPKSGQESVWDYPRPPALEKSGKIIRIVFNGEVIVESNNSYRVLETSHPPVYYIPLEDIKENNLFSTSGVTYCEWKGIANYYDLKVKDKIIRRAGWFYHNPSKEFQKIKNYVAFYSDQMDVCSVDGEIVKPQPGGFYGGWITSDIVGPFKGEEGTFGW